MQRAGAEPVYVRQREIVQELVAAIRLTAPDSLDPVLRESWLTATDDAARLRVVVDQVASLTDRSVVTWHTKLCRR
jgi:dGTPase